MSKKTQYSKYKAVPIPINWDSDEAAELENEKRRCIYCFKILPLSVLQGTHESLCPSAKSCSEPRVVCQNGLTIKFICEKCYKTFKYLNSLQDHQLKHEEPGGFACSYCENKFCFELDLNYHVELNHGIQNNSRFFQCTDCGRKLKTSEILDFHKNELKCGPIKPFPCDKCERSFRTKYLLAQHDITQHLKVKQFCCTYCGEKFSTSDSIARHERTHTGEKPFQCNVCGKSFSHRESLVTHTTVHTGIKPYYCECCGLRFSCTGNLIAHRKKRPDSCGLPQYCTKLAKICPRASLRMKRPVVSAKPKKIVRKPIDPEEEISDIEIPELKSTDANCGPRDIGESIKSSLILTSDKKYLCVECRRKFPMKQSFIRHQKNIHKRTKEEIYEMIHPPEARTQGGKARYTCKHCKKSYISPFKLEEHYKVHGENNQLIYGCSSCPVYFATKIERTTHTRKYHDYSGKQIVASESKFTETKKSTESDENNSVKSEPIQTISANKIPEQNKSSNKSVRRNRKFTRKRKTKSESESEYSNHSDGSESEDNIPIRNLRPSTRKKIAEQDELPALRKICYIEANPTALYINEHNVEIKIEHPPAPEEQNLPDKITINKTDILDTIKLESLDENEWDIIENKAALLNLDQYLEQEIKTDEDPFDENPVSNQDADSPKKNPLPETELFCSICKKQYRKLKYFQSHMKLHKIQKKSLKTNDEDEISSAKISSPHPDPEGEKKSKSAQKEKFEIKEEASQKESLDIFENSYNPGILTAEKEFYCAECQKAFSRKQTFVRHQKNIHKRTKPEIYTILHPTECKPEPTEKPKYKCKYCKKRYTYIRSLESHVKCHGIDGSLVHQCQTCWKYFSSKDEVKKHTKMDHVDQVTCNICNKMYTNAELLGVHKRYAHDPDRKPIKQIFCCNKCGKTMTSKTVLNDHESSDCGRNPSYKCNTCGKRFNTAGSLKSHAIRHSDLTEIQCEFCGKGFATKNELINHRRIHTGERPFACTYCDKAFSHRENLFIHLSTHTGIKRYLCVTCSQRFSCITGLKCHWKTNATTCGADPNRTTKPICFMGYRNGKVVTTKEEDV